MHSIIFNFIHSLFINPIDYKLISLDLPLLYHFSSVKLVYIEINLYNK